MITKYHNRVEATEPSEFQAAFKIVQQEKAAGNKDFMLVPKGNLKADYELDDLMDSYIWWPTKKDLRAVTGN
jgi:hypothetical protein